MEHPTHDQITGQQLRTIRGALGLSQAAFWGAIGVKQPSGSAYEDGHEMPEPVRRLAWLNYVMEIPVNAEPEALRTIAIAVKSQREAARSLKRAESHAVSAASKIMEARQALSGGNG